METQPRSLNTLYKLLWEQIKDDKGIFFSLIGESKKMQHIGKITSIEECFLDESIICNQDTGHTKEFVQRMIKETEKK